MPTWHSADPALLVLRTQRACHCHNAAQRGRGLAGGGCLALLARCGGSHHLRRNTAPDTANKREGPEQLGLEVEEVRIVAPGCG